MFDGKTDKSVQYFYKPSKRCILLRDNCVLLLYIHFICIVKFLHCGVYTFDGGLSPSGAAAGSIPTQPFIVGLPQIQIKPVKVFFYFFYFLEDIST